MTGTLKLVRLLVNLMEVRQNGVYLKESVRVAHYEDWAEALSSAESHHADNPDELSLVRRLVDAMKMQDSRESGAYHLTSDAALAIWNPALTAAIEYLNEETVPSFHPDPVGRLEVPEPATASDAEGYLKQRAEALGQAMSKFDVKLKHGQLLTVVARMEGRQSFQSLKAALKRFTPNFCPHCGAAASLKQVDTVFCEQGEYDGKEFEAEGEGKQYLCIRCQGQFTDWSGLDEQSGASR